jgi:hypothetical protein
LRASLRQHLRIDGDSMPIRPLASQTMPCILEMTWWLEIGGGCQLRWLLPACLARQSAGHLLSGYSVNARMSDGRRWSLSPTSWSLSQHPFISMETCMTSFGKFISCTRQGVSVLLDEAMPCMSTAEWQPIKYVRTACSSHCFLVQLNAPNLSAAIIRTWLRQGSEVS